MKRITLLILALVAFGCAQTAEEPAEPAPALEEEPGQVAALRAVDVDGGAC